MPRPENSCNLVRSIPATENIIDHNSDGLEKVWNKKTKRAPRLKDQQDLILMKRQLLSYNVHHFGTKLQMVS